MNQYESEVTHRVVIAKHAEEYIIKPRTLTAKIGDRVIFSTVRVDEKLRVFFPDAILLGAEEQEPKEVVTLHPSVDNVFTIVEAAGKEDPQDIYPYAAFRQEGRDFIGFHSPGPVIIIYR